MDHLPMGRLAWRAFTSGLVQEIRLKGLHEPYQIMGRFSKTWHLVQTEQDWYQFRLREQEEAKKLRHQIEKLGKRLKWKAEQILDRV